MALSNITYLNTPNQYKVNGESQSTSLLRSDKIAFKTEFGFTIIPVLQICLVESDGPYIKIHTLDKKLTFSRIGINKFEDCIAKLDFLVRCHRSYIVNLNYITKVNFGSNPEITVTNEIVIPIAKNRKEVIKKSIKSFYLHIQ